MFCRVLSCRVVLTCLVLTCLVCLSSLINETKRRMQCIEKRKTRCACLCLVLSCGCLVLSCLALPSLLPLAATKPNDLFGLKGYIISLPMLLGETRGPLPLLSCPSSCLVLLFLVLPYFVLTCLVLSFPVMPCLVLSSLVMVLSCRMLSRHQSCSHPSLPSPALSAPFQYPLGLNSSEFELCFCTLHFLKDYKPGIQKRIPGIQ
jgi:hypothetical protein